MNQGRGTEDELERLIGRTLHQLPLRRAPPALELRVLDELQRRVALPWWRHSIAHWPLAARAVFVVICICLAGAALLGDPRATTWLESLHVSAASWVPWAHEAVAVTGIVGELLALSARSIPQVWLHEALTASALLYAAFFGLAAAAYRTLGDIRS
jgi:hypothetical protein